MQSYLLPYHVASSGAKIVLMGRKNIIGYKAKGKTQTTPIVWNNAGQWVISGGGKDLTDSDEGEAAMREFFEETGIDFRLRKQLEYYGFHSTIKTKLFPLSSSSPDFSVTYILFEDWEGMARDINKNIAAGKVADDELHEVTWSRQDAAKKLLGLAQGSTQGWIQPQIDALLKLADGDKMKLADAKKKLKKQMNKPWDWFEMAIDNLP
jgi:8-oxo-dGTP pyrophosphatase MutT (NUDIX family)